MSVNHYRAKIILIKRWLERENHHQIFILSLSVVIGVIVGVAASLMKTFVILLKDFITSTRPLNQANPLLFILPIIGVLLTLMFLRILLKDNVRHGIPRILYVLTHKRGHMRKHKTFSSFVGGAITSGFGGSAGLESPIISTGAAVSSYISQVLRLDFKTTSLLIGCGAAGAISSIFYTPIAAVIFGIEVLMLDLTTASIIPLLVTSITGAITASRFMPSEVIFQFSLNESATISDIPFLIILGVITGFLSVYFNRINYFLHLLFKKKKNKTYSTIIGLTSLGFLVFLFPPLYGEGYDVLKSIINHGPNKILEFSVFHTFQDHYWFILCFLTAIVLLKVISTTLTIESGGVGGIFAPAVFTGGLIGYIFSSVANKIHPQWNLALENYSIVGMAGVLGGVLHAPLTAIFFAAEITNGYTLMLPIMLVSAISFVTNKVFDANSIITRELAENGKLLSHHKDKNVLTLLNIKKVIDKDFRTINPGCTLGDLTYEISKSRRNIFPVIDDKNNFLGVVAMDDVREDMFKTELYKNPISNYLTQPLDHVSTHDTMEEVMKKFNKTSYYNLPVIDEGKYIGFVSRSNTFSAYRQMLLDITIE